MISKVFKQIRQAKISQETRLLCAVSGGVDSTVMLHILNEFGFECIVAHCNFNLRGKESDEDEKFVRNLAKKLDLRFICESFDTENYANETGLSIQMAARELRYQWFYEMSGKYNCKYIALAHNSDDQIETVITNLVRGTGIRGLCGMKYLKDKLFRPILEISRAEIELFAEKNDIAYRTDSTNLTVKYSRNKIRHQILPLMKEINPSANEKILETISYLKDTEHIFKDYVLQSRLKCLYYSSDGKTVIDLKELKKMAAPKTLLFEILLLEGIPKNMASEAMNLLNAQTGKFLSFFNIVLVKDRNKIIIEKNKKSQNDIQTLVAESELDLLNGFGLKLSIVEKTDNPIIIKNPVFAYIDYERLKFPLTIRKWKEGDKFKPFGMNNFRKLSDFFKDEKLNLFQKNETLIIESEGNIVWIVGVRLDNRFRITENTKKMLILEKK